MTKDDFEQFICADYDQAIDALDVPEWEPEDYVEPRTALDLPENCRIALALYGHYITLGIERKIEEQAQHIRDSFGIEADDFIADPEIGRIEDLLFEAE